jgi:hypothetical protein
MKQEVHNQSAPKHNSVLLRNRDSSANIVTRYGLKSEVSGLNSWHG